MLRSEFHFGSDVYAIISGCKWIVLDHENKLYDRHFRLSKPSDTDLCLRSMYDHINVIFGKSDQKLFSRADVKNWLPQDLQNISPRIIHRNLALYLNNNYLRRYRRVKNKLKKLPGRPKKNENDVSQLNSSRNAKTLYTYSKPVELISLERLVLQITPRAIIYTALKNSGYLERFLKVCEYKKLLEMKSTESNEMLKRLRTHTNTIGVIPESNFNDSKYFKEKEKLSGINRKKKLMMIASDKANNLLQELDWSHRIYTRFFIAGGYVAES